MSHMVTDINQLLISNPFISKNEVGKHILSINKVTANSAQCRTGSLFVATRGATSTSRDGHNFIDDAIACGASMVVVNHDFALSKSYPVPMVTATDSKAALCYFAEAFYGDPSFALKVIGITGTNGKTSTSFMLHSILKHAGFTPKVMGTLGMGDPENLTALTHTTMDPEFISANLAYMRDSRVTHVIMEVSSHALSLKRVEALNFAAVALTNITQDHLDFHGSLKDYQQAKGRLFLELAHKGTIKVLPVDHPFDGLTNNSLFGDGVDANVSFANVRTEGNSTKFILKIHDEECHISLPIFGEFHAKNASLAAAIAYDLGIGLDHIQQGLQVCPQIPGRLESIPNRFSKKIFVDYAHTPDALASLLKSVRNLGCGKLFLVFGCAGDRDKNKRPQMGRIAESLADVAIVTDDNPRTEDPGKIRQDVLSGMINPKFAKEFSDRKSAITYAIINSQEGDVVVIAGKGHENYQIYGNTHFAFSDRLEAKKVVDSL